MNFKSDLEEIFTPTPLEIVAYHVNLIMRHPIGETDDEDYNTGVGKVMSVLNVNLKDGDEIPLVICDTTILSNCTKGFVITNKRFYNLKDRSAADITTVSRVDNPKSLNMEFVLTSGEVIKISAVTVDVGNKKMFSEAIYKIITLVSDDIKNSAVENKSEFAFCTHCGAPNEDGDLFCAKCGHKFE